MLRPDLLALTPDDLAALANRGLTKRAQRECDTPSLQAQWEESPDGTIRATWSDGVTCILPGAGTLRDGTCTCSAVEMCRHILRTVLAWQRLQAAAPAVPAFWDPGAMNETDVKKQAQAVYKRAQTLWDQGVVAELLRGAKPSAHFHWPGHTVRLPVPNDLRYANCSCSQKAPCVHAVLAVKAFRNLAPEMASGIVNVGTTVSAAPAELLAAAQGCVQDLLADGLASLKPSWRDRVRRVAADCNTAALIWPGQILEELSSDFDRYTARDAAFAPGDTVERAGELLLRLDAIRANTREVPQPFIRGLRADKDTDLGASRMLGLGAQIDETRHHTRLTVYLQSADSGHVLTVTHEHAHVPGDTPRPFHDLGRASAFKDTSMATLAAGQLLTQGGRRTASGRLTLGRARAAVNPQAYQWEQLKAPTLVEDFTELAARLRLLPPASFRPRREAADFHVCPLQLAHHASFDPTCNSITAVLRDPAGGSAHLLHPWTTRGSAGAEALLAALRGPEPPLFVAGHVRAAAGQLVIRPAALVFAGPNNSRRLLLPWLAENPGRREPDTQRFAPSGDPLARYAPAAELATDIILNGLRRLKARQWPGWERSITETESQGYHRMAAQLRRVCAGTDAAAPLNLLKLLTLARDLA